MIERHVSVRLLSQVVYFSLIAGDVFILQTNSDVRLFSLVILWILGSIRWQISYKSTLRLSLIFLVLVVLEYLTGRPQQIIERTALWVYVFLFIGTVQNIFILWRK